MLTFTASIRVVVLVCSIIAIGQTDDEWIDPYDMLNYDSSTKTMRKPAEPIRYSDVPTKRRQYNGDEPDCNSKVAALQMEIEDLNKSFVSISQQPTCSPVFKRFLTRLLKLIESVDQPSNQEESIYNAKLKITRQGVTEIQKYLEADDSWRTGLMDDTLSHLVMDVKPLDYEAWKWRFEDTFGVEIDTVLKVCICVMVIVAIICTQLWSVVSWFVQFKRIFAVCFLISIVWNWFYLYKIAFADHQNNIAKMDGVYEKCTGVKKIDWSDGLKEWYRSTWTLQDDPCKRYYEVLMVNPILLVPPTKAISVTITTFITEPLKHVGQGISDFLRALLKDLPVTLQIPVLLTIVLSILVVMYGGVQAAFQHGITGPLRRRRRGPPPPAVDRPQPPRLRDADADYLAGGDATPQGILDRPQVRLRRPHRPREEAPRVLVETLRNADQAYSQDEMDAEPGEGYIDEEVLEHSVDTDPVSEGESDDQELTQASSCAVAQDLPAKQSEAKPKPLESNAKQAGRQGGLGSGAASQQQGEEQESPRCSPKGENKLQSLDTPPVMSFSVEHVETVGSPVQETSPTQ